MAENMEDNFIKKMLGKGKSLVGGKLYGNVEIKSSNWMKEQAYLHEKQTKGNRRRCVTSNAEERISYPNLSREIEWVICELMKKSRNTFKNILVIKNPYQYSPLCALALFKTKGVYRVRVTVKGKTSDCDISYQVGKNTNHRIPIMGLYPDFENTVMIELLDLKGKRVKEKTFKLQVAPLKGKNSEIKITKELSKSEYLYNLTLVYGGGDDGIYPYAFDRNGDIRFCFSMAPKTYGFQPISGGKFLFLNKRIVRLTATNPAATQLSVVDQMGRFYRTYNVEKGAHHDFAETEKGNFVTASNAFDGNTFEDTVVEIDRKTGNVLTEIKIKDYIDSKYVDTADWAHLNTVQYNEDEKTVMVCLRNLHSVMKINYEKKELVWILANPEFWKGSAVADKVLIPEGENMRWFFQAHASYFIDADLDGNPDTKHLIIYDNHTQARRPVSYYDDSKKSFVRIYTINEKKRTVSLLKEFPLKRSNIRSNAVFEADSGKIMAMSGKIKEANDKFKGEIAEIDYNTGEMLNLFSVNHGYYRAYEFKFEIKEMGKAMDTDSDYFLGKIYETRQCESIDTSCGKKLPEPVLEECYRNEAERSKHLRKLAKKNPQCDLEPEQDMARIKMYIEENILYVTLPDHLLEGIYFVGKMHTYVRDFSETKQERPEYFARISTTDSISLNDFEEDKYDIYFKHSIGLYKSGYYIEIIN
ncbi:MAG: aryl-sulfate sulfotransferase [Eubacterium sp.]